MFFTYFEESSHYVAHVCLELEIPLFSLSWWHRSIITALWKLRQEDCEFKANLGYIVKTL